MTTNVGYEGGHSIVTLWGNHNGRFFVCDQWGDGAYIAHSYNPDWDYERYLREYLCDIPMEDIENLMREIISSLNPDNPDDKDVIDEILFIQEDCGY